MSMVEYGRIIVLEDDIVTSPYFLKYMNEALNRYEDEERVMHISGYIYPIKKDGLPDTFFLRFTPCWGWATWKRAWRYFERNPEKQVKLLNRKQIVNFNFNNSVDFWDQLILNLEGKLYTWAIFWYLTVYLNNGLSLFPRDSLTKNIGADGSGTHGSYREDVIDATLSGKDNWIFPEKIEEDQLVRERLEEHFSRYFKKTGLLFLREVVSKILPEKVKSFIKEKIKVK